MTGSERRSFGKKEITTSPTQRTDVNEYRRQAEQLSALRRDDPTRQQFQEVDRRQSLHGDNPSLKKPLPAEVEQWLSQLTDEARRWSLQQKGDVKRSLYLLEGDTVEVLRQQDPRIIDRQMVIFMRLRILQVKYSVDLKDDENVISNIWKHLDECGKLVLDYVKNKDDSNEQEKIIAELYDKQNTIYAHLEKKIKFEEEKYAKNMNNRIIALDKSLEVIGQRAPNDFDHPLQLIREIKGENDSSVVKLAGRIEAFSGKYRDFCDQVSLLKECDTAYEEHIKFCTEFSIQYHLEDSEVELAHFECNSIDEYNSNIEHRKAEYTQASEQQKEAQKELNNKSHKGKKSKKQGKHRREYRNLAKSAKEHADDAKRHADDMVKYIRSFKGYIDKIRYVLDKEFDSTRNESMMILGEIKRQLEQIQRNNYRAQASKSMPSGWSTGLNQINDEVQKRASFHKDYETGQKNLQKRKEYLDEFSKNYVEEYKGAVIETDPKKRQVDLSSLQLRFKTFDENSGSLEQHKQKLKKLTEVEIQRRKKIDEELGIRAENTIEYDKIFTSIDSDIEETLKQRRIDDHRWTNEEIQQERDKASKQVENIVKELHHKWEKVPVLRNFPVEQAWCLIIDGQYQLSDGPKFTIDDEPSIIAGNLRLLNFMLDGLCIEGLEFDGHSPRKLDGQYFQEMHDIAIAGTYRRVEEDNAKEEFQIGYRGFLGNVRDLWFGWGDGYNYTGRGHEELWEKFQCRRGGEGTDPRYSEAGHPVGNSCLDPFYDNGQYYKTKEATWRECLTIANTIINKYYDEIKECTTQDEKLTAIVRCGQDLEQAHLLPDGNIRTITCGVILKLLLEQGEYPPIWHNPNILDGYDVKTLKAKIREGQKTTLTYVNPIMV